MPWIVLMLSGLMECVWATALGRIDGLSRPLPIVFFLGGMALSMLGLFYAMRSIPTGTAYAVWTGIGACATVITGIVLKTEPVSVAKLLLIAGLIACVIGLKFVSE